MIRLSICAVAVLSLLITVGAFAEDSGDDKAIKKIIDNFVTAWNKHDPRAMATLWDERGDLVTPEGQLATDRDEVEKIFTDEQTGKMGKSHMKQSVEFIRFLTPTLAFVDADALVTGLVGEDGKTQGPTIFHVVYIFEKKGDMWVIQAVRAYAINSPIMKVNR